MWRSPPLRASCDCAPSLAKTPVHLLLDIDGTLLRIVGKRNHGPTHATAGGQRRPLYDRLAHLETHHAMNLETISFTNPARSTEQQWTVLLRPHVVPFLRAILVDRRLDTATVSVSVSLYTRQPREYSEAIARDVLTPRVLGPSGADQAPLFSACLGGAHCVQDDLAARRASDNTWPCVGSSGWSKTVGVTGSPATTLLVEDTLDNFQVDEWARGHCALVPSFGGWDSSWASLDTDLELDDVFCCRPAQSAQPALLPLLASFVSACEHLPRTPDSLVPPLDGMTHRHAGGGGGPAEGSLPNFLTEPAAADYKRRWEEWHTFIGAESALF